MTGYENEHDRVIERILERLAASGAEHQAASAEADALERSYTDLVALLPFAERPQVPDPAIKAALMTSVREDGGATEEAEPIAPVPLSRSWSAAQRSWTLALAAMFGVCLVGVAFLSGRVSEQRDQIATLEAMIEDSVERGAERAQLAEDRMHLYERKLAMINTIARQVYPMQQASLSAETGTRPRGKLWVCGQHQRWYLSVQGLQDPPEGFTYTLWFVTPDGLVRAGQFDVGMYGRGELDAPEMPIATSSFQITLEPAGIHPGPTGRPVLVAGESIAI